MKYQRPEKLSDSKLKAYHWWLHSRYSREDVSRKEVVRKHVEAVRVMEARGLKHPGRDKLDRATADNFEQNVEEEREEAQSVEAGFVQSVEEVHSRSKCMSCDEPPVVDVQWADGRGRAWFCLPHFKEWIKGEYEGDDREIVRAFHILDGEVPEKIGKGNQVKKMADELSAGEIVKRVEQSVGMKEAGYVWNEAKGRGWWGPPRDVCEAEAESQDFAQSDEEIEERDEQVEKPDDSLSAEENEKLSGVEEARRLDDTYKPEYFEEWMDWDRHVRAWSVMKPFLRGQSFLDVGCGMGFALMQLKKSGYQVRGTEVSPWAIGFCAGMGLEVDKAGATKLPYEDDTFDTVFSMFLLNNLPQPEKAVKEATRVARMRAVHLVPGEWEEGRLMDGFKVIVHDKEDLAAKPE